MAARNFGTTTEATHKRRRAEEERICGSGASRLLGEFLFFTQRAALRTEFVPNGFQPVTCVSESDQLRRHHLKVGGVFGFKNNFWHESTINA